MALIAFILVLGEWTEKVSRLDEETYVPITTQ